MHDAGTIEDKLREESALPETLALGFEAFEVIRLTARACEVRVPGLFAAFMTTADAAVTGREALTNAPSLPAVRGPQWASEIGPGAPMEAVTGTLARLAALLSGRLAGAARLARLPGDSAACGQAAEAARRIHQLMAGGDGDGRPR